MKMTMREIWSLTCSDQQIAPTYEGQSMAILQEYHKAWRKKRDQAIRNLFAGKRWDSKD